MNELNFLPQEAIQDIISVVEDSYKEVLDAQFGRRGFNAATFGYCVYNLITDSIIRLVASKPDKYTWVKEGNLGRLQIGSVSLGFYGLDGGRDKNIHESFPNKNNKASHPITNRGQRALFDDEPAIAGADNYYIVGHKGDHEEGLYSIHLCSLGMVMNGEIMGWSETHKIYDSLEVSYQTYASAEAPIENIPEFDLEPKKVAETSKDRES